MALHIEKNGRRMSQNCQSGMCDARNVDDRVGTASDSHLLSDRQAEMSSRRLVCTLGVLLSGSLLQAPGELTQQQR